jgi:hypothetical protein
MIYVMGEKRMNSLDAYIWFKNYQILYFGDMLKIWLIYLFSRIYNNMILSFIKLSEILFI